MSAPTPVPETYIACVTLGASIAGITGLVMEGGFTPDFDVDDMTNNGGGGHYEDVKTTDKLTFSLKIAVKTPLLIVSGAIYPVLINAGAVLPTVTAGVMAPPVPVVAAGPACAANVRIKVDPSTAVNVKAGLVYNLTGTSQGPYSYIV